MSEDLNIKLAAMSVSLDMLRSDIVEIKSDVKDLLEDKSRCATHDEQIKQLQEFRKNSISSTTTIIIAIVVSILTGLIAKFL